MTDTITRLIGRKEILPVMAQMYGIYTWRGALLFIKRRNLPLKKTPSGRPMFIVAELIRYDQKFQSLLDK